MNKAGILLDTGPLVALLNSGDQNHQKTCRFLTQCVPPFITTEAVITEACFLAGKISYRASLEVIDLGQKGFYKIGFSLAENLDEISRLFQKYHDVPVSLADASLVVCAGLYNESRIFTFDSDFEIYRWNRNKKFNRLQ